MSSTTTEKYLTVAIRVARSAGQLIASAFHDSAKQFDTKESFRDLVTATDKEVERRVVDELRESFPHHHFIGEESATGEKFVLSDEPTWIIDPIDGTCNFVHRIPHTGISMALLVGKRTIVAVVFNPLTDELYRAVEGGGAFCNDRRISVSGTDSLADAVVICDVWASLVEKIRGFRSFGSGVLNMCFVARGISDAYIEYGIHCWDMAAASLIVREAGGVVVDPTGVRRHA